MNSFLKIVFAGTPEISQTILANILAHNFQVELVLTQPDRPAGRGLKLTASPVKQLALEKGIKVLQPLTFKENKETLAQIRELAPDIMVVVSYGLILPKELLDIPRLGCVNIHVSLLPKWRGAAPIARAVLAADQKSGITIIQMDTGLDTGDMLLVAELDILPKETAASLYDKLAELGATKIVEFLANPEFYSPVKQSTNGISYAHKLSKEEAKINWSEQASVIERNIRGFNPVPGAFSFLDGKLHKFWQADVIEELTQEASGTIIRANKFELLIACGNGTVLAIKELQEAGAKRKPIVQYLQGKSNLVGKYFSD